ncbi:MAG TPA: metalloregulator ArsR/SmtB family transcription factor [Bacillales bacterium]|nr:metalloregulator ArsR/SmtB family transcription factor [Bacillales bacterium]
MTNIYRAMSDPVRRKILSKLAKAERTQSEIVREFDISQPAITKHLRILKEEGLISEAHCGRYRIYGLDQSAFESAYQEMVQEIDTMLGRTLDDLKHYVENKGEEDD